MKLIHLWKVKRYRSIWPLLLLLLCVLLLSIFVNTPSSQKEGFAQEKAEKSIPQLSNADCIKCHQKVQETINANGGKHKTAVTCMDCHRGHPPMVSKEKIIPACKECHAGKAHYEIEGCNSCHSDPHAPLEMKLAANITDPCISCHEKEGEDLKNNPNKHTNLSCTGCHPVHKEIPLCLNCHQPHSPEMVNKDCLMCHPAHKPLVITYGSNMPSKYCAACHKNISDTLTGVGTKHSSLACVFCHKERHKMIPTCESCHGTPHPAGMLSQFPQCDMCHISAHSLGKEAKK
jgi:predicted CXXCH cytochrome family protein